VSITIVAWVLIAIAVIAANLPWLSDRVFLFWPPPPQGKRFWQCLVEWLFMYALMGLLGLGLERKATGHIHAQGWEFITVTFFLFVVFALPGFIYRYEFRRLLRR